MRPLSFFSGAKHEETTLDEVFEEKRGLIDNLIWRERLRDGRHAERPNRSSHAFPLSGGRGETGEMSSSFWLYKWYVLLAA